MKRILASLLCGLAALCLSGCLQVDETVKLKPDGSGTIEETVLMSKMMVEQMKMMSAGGFGGDAAKQDKPKEFSLLDEDQLKKDAAKKGEGVTFVSAKKVSTTTGEGYTAIYAFADINKVKIDQNPASSAPKMGPDDGEKPDKKEIIGFQFTKGKPAQLVITMPEPDLKKKDKPKKEKQDPAMMQMAMQMFKDAKFSVGIEVQGAITETNATHHEGSRVTLMEMDFNKVIADPKKFQELVENEPDTIEEAKEMLKQVPGIKMEMNREVKVKFQ